MSKPWAISVTGGRALGFVGRCGTRPISSLRLGSDPELPDPLFGAFRVELAGDSATVEITAPRAKSGDGLAAAECEDQDSDGLLRDVLVRPRQLVFEVVPLGYRTCYVEGQLGAPTTDTLPARQPRRPATSPLVFALLACIAVASTLVGLRARR